ncbi:unnamed protein product [Malus baccata var. baccata]
MGAFNEARMAGLKLDRFTYAGVLSVCGQTSDFELGKLVHGLIVVNRSGSEVVLTNSLIDMYSKCGRVDHARNLFQSSDNLDHVSWNSLIACYARIGLFGKILHGYNVKLGLDLDVVVGTTLLDMYAKTYGLGEAIQIFKFMPYRNVVLYNAMIAGFLQIETFSYGHANEVFNLLSEMQRLGIKPSTFTFSIILSACKSVEALEYGKQVHTQVYKYDLQGDEFIGSGLIDFYCSLGLSNYALRCFNLTPRLDIVSWTSMIAGYIQNGEIESAFDLFYKLLESGMKPDEFIISSMLGACADLAAARSGEQIQGYAVKAGFGKFLLFKIHRYACDTYILEDATEAFYVLDKFKNLPEESQGKNFLDPGRLESLIGLDHQLDKRIDFTTKRIEFFEGVGRNQVDAGVDSDEMVAILVSEGVVIQPIQNKLCEHRA